MIGLLHELIGGRREGRGAGGHLLAFTNFDKKKNANDMMTRVTQRIGC